MFFEFDAGYILIDLKPPVGRGKKKNKPTASQRVARGD